MKRVAMIAIPLLLLMVSCGDSSQVTSLGSNPSDLGISENLPVGDHYNHRGNILIADQYNNRAVEINRKGAIVWQFGLGPMDVSERSVIAVNDVERIGDLTLMAATGAPPGSEPLCQSGCPDNRVLLVNRWHEIIWQYGRFGVTGAASDELNAPVQSTWLPNGNILITDQGNQRVIEVTIEKQIVWQYGTTGVSGNMYNQLNNPNSAELLVNGHILIADEGNDRAIEVDRHHKIIATFTGGGTASGVAFASRLLNGHTLLSDSNNNRIIEVDRRDRIVWEYITNLEPGSNPSPSPTRGLRLVDGNTIISDQNNQRVIIVNPAKRIVARYGNLNLAGYGTLQTHQGLDGPYDAKVIGDYTGITQPFEQFGPVAH